MSALMFKWSMEEMTIEDPLLDRHALRGASDDQFDSQWYYDSPADGYLDVSVEDTCNKLIHSFNQCDGVSKLTALNKAILILVNYRNDFIRELPDSDQSQTVHREMTVHDPVHLNEEDNQWYFWMETWHDRYGPYESEGIARKALDEYCKWLDSGGDPGEDPNISDSEARMKNAEIKSYRKAISDDIDIGMDYE